MDEIKSVISQLPEQDIIILKTIYSPDMAKQQLSDNWQRMVAILDWLSPEDQQDAVNIVIEEAPQQEPLPEENTMPAEQTEVEAAPEEQINPAGNLEDFLI